MEFKVVVEMIINRPEPKSYDARQAAQSTANHLLKQNGFWQKSKQEWWENIGASDGVDRRVTVETSRLLLEWNHRTDKWE